MRNKWLCAMTILSAFVICGPGVAADSHLHRPDGTLIELQMSDSLVSLLFVASAQLTDSSTFARERPELRDNGPAYGPGRSIHTFAIEPGLNPVSVMQELRTDPRVLMVNPVIRGIEGHDRWMTDSRTACQWPGSTR
jgi:hypothetical protein